MTGKTITDLHEGDHAELTRAVDPADIAATTSFKTPIAPGIFTAGMISAVIGTRLPGPGSIYLSQALTFLRPVRTGDTITARVEVAELLRDRNRVRLKTVCTNQRGEEVLVGEAWVLPSRQPVPYEERPRAVVRRALTPCAVGARAVAVWARRARSLLSGKGLSELHQ